MRILAFLLALLAGPALADVWYVCPDSQGEYGLEDGTSLPNCFDGSTDAWAVAGHIDVGDTVYYCGDFGPADARVVVTDSGTAFTGANFITLSGNGMACGRGGRNSTWDRTGTTGANTRAIAGTGRAYIKIEDFDFMNCDQCILFDITSVLTEDTSIWLDDVSFDGCRGVLGDCIWKRGVGLTITNSSFNDCGEDCIWVRGKNVSMTDSSCTDISTGSVQGDCIQVDGTGITDSGYAIIARNYCDHPIDRKYCFLVGATSGVGSSVTITDNTALCPSVASAPSPDLQCHPIYVDVVAATAVVIERNKVQGGETGIAVTSAGASAFTTRARIISNIVRGSTDKGITVDANVDNIDIFGNDVSGSGRYNLHIGKASSPNVNANNNLLLNAGTAGMFFVTEPTSRTHNAYFGNAVNISANGVTTATTTGDLTSDPDLVKGSTPTQFVNFRRKSTSPLRCAGKDVGRRTDVFGRGYEPGCFPIGAAVYGRGDARTTPLTARP